MDWIWALIIFFALIFLRNLRRKKLPRDREGWGWDGEEGGREIENGTPKVRKGGSQLLLLAFTCQYLKSQSGNSQGLLSYGATRNASTKERTWPFLSQKRNAKGAEDNQVCWIEVEMWIGMRWRFWRGRGFKGKGILSCENHFPHATFNIFFLFCSSFLFLQGRFLSPFKKLESVA